MKDIIIWKLLRSTKVFDYWYKRFLADLLYRLQRFDIDGDETFKYYKEKYNQISQ